MVTERNVMLGIYKDHESSIIQNALTSPSGGERTQTTVDVAPIPIYLSIPLTPANDQALPDSRVILDLVLDAAGKVRSAQLDSRADRGPIGDTLIRASADWNFIPAFKAHRAVACRIRLGVSPQQ